MSSIVANDEQDYGEAMPSLWFLSSLESLIDCSPIDPERASKLRKDIREMNMDEAIQLHNELSIIAVDPITMGRKYTNSDINRTIRQIAKGK
jgi:hypothetical protein